MRSRHRLSATIIVFLLLATGHPHLVRSQDLQVYMTADREVAGPGDAVTYTLTATNKGASALTGISAQVLTPESIGTFRGAPGFSCSTCSADRSYTWTIGTLAPGESRTVFYRVPILATATEGTISSSVMATGTGTSDATDSLDVSIDPSPLLRLSLVPEPGPAVAGEPFTYTLTFGNIGSSAPTDVTLRMPVPSGASFSSATRGGTVSDGVVSWNIGTLGVGQGDQVRLTVIPNGNLGDGNVLLARAELDPGTPTAYVVRSSAATPVRTPGPLKVEYTVSQTAREPGGQLDYTLVATNSGATTLTGVEARLFTPGAIGTFRGPPGFSCSTCSADTPYTWTIGTLAPGESRTVFFRATVAGSARQGGVLHSLLTAEAAGSGQVTAALDVQVDPTPLLRLRLTPDPGPAVPGEKFTYTITFGNVGSSSPSGVTLRVPVPAGAGFSSASGGGTFSDGIVSWDVGTLGVGQGRQVRLTVDVDGDLREGEMLLARAELDPGTPTAYVVRSSAATPIRTPGPLKVEYAVSQTAQAPGGPLDYTLVATNSGTTTLTGAEARLYTPGSIGTFRGPPGFSCSTCSAGTPYTWTIGTLAPGESRTVFFRAFVAGSAMQGAVLHSMLVAESSGSGQVTAALDVQVDPTPLFRLRLTPDSGPAVPGEKFVYTISLGNIGSSSPAGVVLRMPVPAGTSFSSASGGGTFSDGIVSWDVGTVGVGQGRQVRVTVEVDGDLRDGDLLLARAELDPGTPTAYVVRSSAATPVRTQGPLHVEYAVSQAARAPGSPLDFTLVATNSGTTALTGVVARLYSPGSIGTFRGPTGFSCSTCSADTPYTWTIGTLAPGESRTVFFRAFLAGSARQGDVLHSMLAAESSGSGQVTTALDVHVDPAPLLSMSLKPDSDPAVVGKDFTYTITFGNIGSSAPTGVVLRMPVPDGASFSSATGGGTFSDGVVTWNVGTLGVGQGGQVRLTVDIHGMNVDGVLRAEAEIDAGLSTAYVVRSSAVKPLRAEPPLRLEYSASHNARQPGEAVDYTVVATNAGAVSLTDVSVRLLTSGWINTFSGPTGFSCSTCSRDTPYSWTIGSLAPGENATATFTNVVASAAPRGEILRSRLHGTATGSNEVDLQQDVFIGTLIELQPGNQPPSPAVLTSPDDASEHVLGGATEDDAMPPDTPFIIEWEPASDPEGDPVTYRWQISDSESFTTLLADAASDDNGTATVYTTTYGALSSILADLGVGPGESVTLYHRVLASDAQNTAVGGHFSIVLTRGTLVGIEQLAGLPEAFALHGNYPNPFNPSTTFRFDLPESGTTTLTVFDALGREVAVVVSEQLPAGMFAYEWDASGLPSGVYLYRLQTGGFAETKKLILLK